MALIKCSECGKEISDKASSCPNCGCPIEKAKKKVRIMKTGGLALRCSVFIDNQPVGQIGVGSIKSIELEIPVGTHYISTITQVKNQNTFITTYGTNTMATPITTSTSQEQDGKQFEVKESDELIVIEILTKGSFTGSTGRCVIGNISNYDINNIDTAEKNIKDLKGNFIKNHLTLIIALIIMALFLLLSFSQNLGMSKLLLIFVITIVIVFIFLSKKK